jgi:hypothetical protein
MRCPRRPFVACAAQRLQGFKNVGHFLLGNKGYCCLRLTVKPGKFGQTFGIKQFMRELANKDEMVVFWVSRLQHY